MTRRTIRDAWLHAVMFRPRLGDSCRRVLFCLAMAEDRHGPWMSSNGRIRPIKHRTVGEALGMSEKTIANHILEATKAGFLTKDPTTGYRGRPAAYQATFPATSGVVGGPVSLRNLVAGALKVPGNGESPPPEIREPFPAAEDAKVPRFREAQRACARARGSYTNREPEPAPDDSRADGDQDGTSQASSYGSWLPAPVSAYVTSSERKPA